MEEFEDFIPTNNSMSLPAYPSDLIQSFAFFGKLLKSVVTASLSKGWLTFIDIHWLAFMQKLRFIMNDKMYALACGPSAWIGLMRGEKYLDFRIIHQHNWNYWRGFRVTKVIDRDRIGTVSGSDFKSIVRSFRNDKWIFLLSALMRNARIMFHGFEIQSKWGTFDFINQRAASAMEKHCSGCRDLIRKSFEIKKVPRQSIGLMIVSLRQSLLKHCDCTLKKWKISVSRKSWVHLMTPLTDDSDRCSRNRKRWKYKKTFSKGYMNCALHGQGLTMHETWNPFWTARLP